MSWETFRLGDGCEEPLAVPAAPLLTLVAAFLGTSPANNFMEYKLLETAQVYLLCSFLVTF